MHHLSLPPSDIPPECNPYAPCTCHSCQAFYTIPPISSFTMPPPFPPCYPIPDIPFPIPQIGLHPILPILPGIPHPGSVYQTNSCSMFPAVSTVTPNWSSYRPIPRVVPSALPYLSSPSSYSYSSGVSAIGKSSPSATELSETPSPVSSMAEEASSSSAAQEKADMKTAQELADLEKLSAQYEPDVNGPLVGELQSSKILEAEYAGADQVYVRKTAALSPKYSNYRTIKGDGNCGWRALAFGYFELLLRAGDPKLIEKELERVNSLSSLLDSVGMSEYLYEDFVQETTTLLETISKSPIIDNPYDDKPLVEAFNKDDVSNAIITHLKLLTSAFLKVYPDAYEPFLVDHPTIDEYRSAQIEPYGVQIDHLGVKALIDALFIPAGLSVEISYLDRSDSDEVNVHKFEDESAPASAEKKEGQEQRTLRMLYRPGHYDLIYKNGDLAPPSLPTSPTTSPKAAPGLGNVRVSMMLEQEYTNNPFLPSPVSTSVIPGLTSSSNDACDHCFPALRSYRSHDGTVSSIQKLRIEVGDETDPPLQTKMFKNSHYNTRHFQNEHFQPEMWGPNQIEKPKVSKRAFWKKFNP